MGCTAFFYAFKASGIKIDSSTSFGAFNLKEDQKYDFRKMPKKAVYRFSEDVTIEDEKGEFIEVPISSYKQNFLLKMIRKMKEKKGVLERTTDGVHTRSNDPLKIKNNPSLMERLIWFMTIPTILISSLQQQTTTTAHRITTTQRLNTLLRLKVIPSPGPVQIVAQNLS